MKILGFEITKAQTTAEKAVTVEKSLQETQPSVPLKSSFPKKQLGDSGSRGLHGVITDEYNPNLQGVQGIKVYDEMRKGDGTVRAAMLVTTLPIRRAQWFVNPATEDQKDKDIASFVEHALFDWIEKTSWDDIIRQALLMVPFGVMVFEKVYGTKDHEGKTYVVLNKLAPRLPKSIMQWELTDGTFGIQQIRQDGITAQIPGSKLLVFVNEREGDNWWGTSMLRAAYKHWYYKNNFYKIDGMAFERQGMGVPLMKMPVGYTESDEAKAVTAMRNLRANEDAYLIIPQGYEAEFMKMDGKGSRDPEKSISHHNKEILLSVLAQFLELGQSSSGGGSRALSEDHSDIFLKALEAIANNLISEINNNLIPELVDMNFNDVTVYPKLDFSGITKVDVAGLGTAYAQLVTAGAITPTNEDEQYLRAAMGLPARSQEDVDEAESAEEMIDGIDNDDVDIDDEETDASKKKKDDAEAKKDITKKKAHEHLKLVRKYDDGQGFKSWRPLTFAEKKVSFSNIEETINQLESEFAKEATVAMNKAKDNFMKKLHKAMDAGDTKAIAELEILFVNEYKGIVKDAMKKAYEYGKNNVATEMGVTVPPSMATTNASIDLLADTIANKAASDVESQAKISTANALKNNITNLQAAGLIDSALESAITKTVNSTAGLIIGQGVNMGRNDVFVRNRGLIYALQRSEILDAMTCSFCLSMDGLIVEPTDAWASYDVFHSNCRGIWVEILKDEENPPAITGVPADLGDYYGGQPNSLIQPPNPIIIDSSPAKKEVERRAEAKKKKKK